MLLEILNKITDHRRSQGRHPKSTSYKYEKLTKDVDEIWENYNELKILKILFIEIL